MTHDAAKCAAVEREVEIHLLGAEDLHRLGLFRRMAPVAVVSLAGRPERFQTAPDARHGDDPRWNERFTFAVPEWLVRASGTRFELEVFAEGCRMHSLGTVHIPLEPARLDGRARKYFILFDGNKQGHLKAALSLGAQKAPAQDLEPGVGAEQHSHHQRSIAGPDVAVAAGHLGAQSRSVAIT